MINIFPVRAFKDNYIWIIHNQQVALIIDPGNAAPVLNWIDQQKLQPLAILCTHHHSDHTGGIAALVQEFSIPVYGPANETIPNITHPLTEDDTLNFPALALTLDVLDIPGHTAGHIAYYGHQSLFCGDTLFSCGCGRIFEGSPQQMFTSLQKLARLPDETRVYCAHEYTLSNIQFARILDPDNTNLLQWEHEAQQKLAQQLPTLPTNLALEKTVNPFLRCDQPAIIQSASQYVGHQLDDPVSIFAAIRSWKNNF